MKTKITLLALLISGFMNAQSLVWSKQISGGILNGFHVTTDASGNVFTTGYFSGTVDFDPGSGVHNLTSAGPSAFVSKLDASGNLLWAVNVAATGTNSSASNGRYAIKTDASGNAYVVGFFYGTCDFDPGQGVFSLTSYTSTVYSNSFIWKLDANGNFLWAKQAEESIYIFDITIDASGNLLAAGTFTGTSDFNLDSGISNLTSVGVWDAFISKMDASGTLLNVKQIGGNNAFCNFKSISTDAFSNIYALGHFSGSVDTDPGSGTNIISSSNDQNFSLKLNASGAFVSAVSIDPPLGTCSVSLVSNDLAGNTYVVGQYAGICDFDPSAAVYTMQASTIGLFVYKLNPSGAFVWAKGIDGANNPACLRFDNGGTIVFSGAFTGSIDADPGSGIFTLNASSGNSFICSLNSSGNFVSAVTSSVRGDLALDMTGAIYVYGLQGSYLYTNKYTSIYTGINKNQKSNLNLNLFPNPGTGNFILDKTFESDCAVEIYNGSGQKVYMETMSTNSLSIDLKDCATGVYTIRVADKENTVWQKKLIKQ